MVTRFTRKSEARSVKIVDFIWFLLTVTEVLVRWIRKIEINNVVIPDKLSTFVGLIKTAEVMWTRATKKSAVCDGEIAKFIRFVVRL